VYNIELIFKQLMTIKQTSKKMLVIISEPEFSALSSGVINFKVR